MILRHLKVYLFLVLLILILLIGVFGRTSFHTRYIESLINNRISTLDLNLTIEKTSGFLFSTFYFDNIQVTNSNKSVYSIKKIAININLLSLLIGESTLDLVSLEGINGIIQKTKKNNRKIFNFSESLKVPFDIKSLFIDGKLNRSINGNEYGFNFFIGGSFTKENGNNLRCDILKINTAGTLAMSIDSNHNVLIGTTNTNMATASGSQSGTQITDGGIAIAANNPVAQFNRVTDDGAIVNFRKNGAVVGSIGTVDGDLLIHSSGTAHKGLRLGNGYIAATDNAGVIQNNTTDLGLSSQRFRHLYLSGGVIAGPANALNVGTASNFSISNGDIQLTLERTTGSAGWGGIGGNSANALHVYNSSIQKVLQVSQTDGSIQFPQSTSAGIYLGGTGSANRLDDYEEGTWNVLEKNGQGGTVTVNRAHYTKIGNIVHAFASVTVGSTTNVNTLNFTLPFTSSINGYYLGGGSVGYHKLPSAQSLNLRPNIENAAADVHFLYGDNSTYSLKVTCSQASTKRIDFYVTYHTHA